MIPFDPYLRHTLEGKLDSVTPYEFEQDFEKLTSLGHNLSSIVYVLNSDMALPRLRGNSRIIYIGKTKYTMPQRYTTRVIRADTQNYWKRYKHIITNYPADCSEQFFPEEDPVLIIL